MNEFEWRRQLRQLRQPDMPQRDLWPAIDAALTRAEHDPASPLEAAPPRQRRRARWLLGAALAASLLLAGNVAWRAIRPPAAAPTSAVAAATRSWKPSDPRLAGAAIELNAAQMELKLAIEQAPDSPALQRLLTRTEMQQTHLRELANQAG